MTKSSRILTFCFFMFCICPPAHGEPADELGGTVRAEMDGKVINFPTLKTDIETNIQGDLAHVKIIQVFSNPLNVALNAQYLFPMDKDGAVHAMSMEVGDEIVEAKIQRKEEAQQTFETAKKEGKAASLLTQHRPNMFTQNIANLMPGMPIKITLQYVQTVSKTDGQYELVLPLIVGPRYQPEGAGLQPAVQDNGVSDGLEKSTSRSSFGKWEIEKLPDYPTVAGLDLPQSIEEARVSINVHIKADMPLEDISSATHDIDINGTEKEKSITLQQGRVIENRDFVLRYSLSGEQAQAGILATRNAQGGFFSLLIEPPAIPKALDIMPREMVFVLDTSGSMSGEPIDASKTFMRHALKNLKHGDYFRIIRFSDNASEFTNAPVSATAENIQDGMRYVESLDASGGTEIPSAIAQAFSVQPKAGTLRIVVFLTDGYIGNESTVLNQIANAIGDSRIYAFGVGTSVNRYLLSEMGRMGRGFARFIDPTEKSDDVAIQLASKLEAPVLTDITVDWGNMIVEEITPTSIPDLFAGDSIRIQGKFKGRGNHVIQVKGKVNGGAASLPVEVTLPEAESYIHANDNTGPETARDAIALIWARSRIADMMRHIEMPQNIRKINLSDDQIKEKVVSLGLDFSLVTDWTSFVAVSRKVVNQSPDLAQNTKIPLPMVKGITDLAYGQNFAGGSTPEPTMMGGLIILGGAAMAALRRKRKEGARG